jgi:hypothetical protein
MGGFTMYVRSDLAVRMHTERLEEAQMHRNAYRVRAMQRAQRRADRAERRMSRAHREASRLRLGLEAES